MRQIMKKWRSLSADVKAPFLTQARENRTKLMRGKKIHQVGILHVVLILRKYSVPIPSSNCTYIYRNGRILFEPSIELPNTRVRDSSLYSYIYVRLKLLRVVCK